MYAPTPYFSDDMDVARDLVENIVMGTLITSGKEGSPLPFMFEDKGGRHGQIDQSYGPAQSALA